MSRPYADSPDPVKRELAQLQQRAAHTRKAIYTRRAQGMRTSLLEARLAELLHQIEILTAQLPPRSQPS